MRRVHASRFPWFVLLLFVVAAPAVHASFIVTYFDAEGTGFYDAVLGAGRRAAFEYAVSQYDSWLGSTAVPIRIETGWSSLASGALGQSQSTQSLWRDFSGAEVTGTWYGDALADFLHGSSLGGDTWDMKLTFNLNFSTWNYDYTLADGGFAGLYDFTSVAMHEIGHGMGLWSTFTATGAWGYGTGYPSIYDRFLEYADGTDLIATSPAPDVTTNPEGEGAADDGIYWSGADATAAHGGERVQLYSPATWSSGSSLSHLNNTGYTGLLMNYAIGTNDERRFIDDIMSGMLTDIGWEQGEAETPEPATVLLVVLGVGPIVIWRRRRLKPEVEPDAA